MEETTSNFAQIIEQINFVNLTQALLIAGAGLFVARLVSATLRRMLGDSATPQVSMLVQRSGYYLVLGLFLISALWQLGFNLGVLVGAAGILTVAIGFASQTSMSNLISGLFLIGERPFAIGDIIKVGTTVGEVLSIDLLSIKLRNMDNTYVRIPNETIIKTEVINLTKFPIRRVDMQLKVALNEDVTRVREVLGQVAEKNPLVLDEPQPLFIFQGFGESAVNFQYSVWGRREEWLNLKNEVQIEIMQAFLNAGIEIPAAYRKLSPDPTAEPFSVRLVEAAVPASSTGNGTDHPAEPT